MYIYLCVCKHDMVRYGWERDKLKISCKECLFLPCSFAGCIIIHETFFFSFHFIPFHNPQSSSCCADDIWMQKNNHKDETKKYFFKIHREKVTNTHTGSVTFCHYFVIKIPICKCVFIKNIQFLLHLLMTWCNRNFNFNKLHTTYTRHTLQCCNLMSERRRRFILLLLRFLGDPQTVA